MLLLALVRRSVQVLRLEAMVTCLGGAVADSGIRECLAGGAVSLK